MNFNEYQKEAKKTAVFPENVALTYLTLGLVGEAGEIANKVKKIYRGDYAIEDIRDDLKGELGDVLWYLSQISHFLSIEFDEIADNNIKKLRKRYERGKIKGSGDNR